MSNKPARQWKWHVLVAFFSWVTPVYAATSRKITNAMERAADRIISNRCVIRKALCAMILVPYGWLILLAGKEQTAKVAFIPDRLVVLYSTHRPIFPWEKIGGGKKPHSTPAGIYVSKLIICTGSIIAITVP